MDEQLGSGSAEAASPGAPIDDGGSAFPELTCDREYSEMTDSWKYDFGSAGGMTLRDYFAIRALHGLIALGPGSHNLPSYQLEMAGWAYGYADAMLKARGGAR